MGPKTEALKLQALDLRTANPKPQLARWVVYRPLLKTYPSRSSRRPCPLVFVLIPLQYNSKGLGFRVFFKDTTFILVPRALKSHRGVVPRALELLPSEVEELWA